ncbi:MAG: aspartate kinase [Acidobacteria bacterium]|nr:aspartate kinase [Acidobacteriota bacterium]
MIVRKFGGSSVADPDAIRRLIEIVRHAHAEHTRGPIVVVSAMGGVTDGLLAVAASAGAMRVDEALGGLEQLRERHLQVMASLTTGERGRSVVAFTNIQFDELESVVRALAILREVTPRTLDAIAAAGELLSSRLVSAALEEADVPATWLDTRRLIVTDDEHTRAAPLMRETSAALRASVAPLLDSGRVPVLGGFVGATPPGITTTLGRGGSDYSAALVGAGVAADEIQIWTDVDGMLTADPRVVPRLSYAEASELAYFGAKVLHPSTIIPAVEREIPVRIMNSRKPDGTGTLITASRENGAGPFVALACKRDLAVVHITSSRMLMAYGFLRLLFEVFERFRTAVDVVTTSEVSVSVTVDDRRNLDAIVQALRECADVSIEPDMALLCAVGDNLRMAQTTVARMLRVLENVPLRMVSQAASRRNITVVLREADLPDAMQRLHAEFFE